MTTPRKVVAGITYLITRRCTQRQLLLRPDERVVQIYLYCLAEAAQRYDLTVVGYVVMSNHQHIEVRDNLGNFPEFLAHFNKMVAKAMNAHLGRCENLWATEQPNAVHLVEAEDRFAKLVYLLANPVAADLVEHVIDWPGACSFGQNLSGRTITIERPRGGFFRDKSTMPEEVELTIERPDGFESLTDEQWSAKLKHAVRAAEKCARDDRRKRGVGVLGRKEVLLTSPTDFPKSIERRRGLRPCIACRNIERRIHELGALVAFRFARKAALDKYRAGERDVPFPHGTYRVRGVFLTAPPPAPFALCA